ncbi:hypothetical protein DL764_008797 [Monosporascus ibericus]|uniref:BTB domain-containing protein n=1 Tax=Monosporascus ibericus TaxID=155417 RepID=A0A4Q4SWK2_9PEZI|nr:hypothetical protein DL764_008797 [Monosporascus ibericus]
MPLDAVNTIHPFADAEQLDLIRTKPIKFIIGCENAEFYLQPGFVSRLSAPMDALIRNGVKGPGGFCVTWDIDVDLFLRLVQFVYTGSYTCLVGKLDKYIGIDVLPESGPFAGEAFKLPYSLASYELGAKTWTGTPCMFSGHQGSSLFKPARKRKSEAVSCDCGPSQTRISLISAFMSTYIHGQGRLFFRPEPTTQVDEALLCHVRMWAFAEKYAIKQLADVASFRLAYELAHWTISATTFVPIFSKLVHHTYAICKTEAGGLRQLVASYAACVGEDIAVLEGWEALLQDVHGFTLDLVQQMMARRSSGHGRVLEPPPSREGALFGRGGVLEPHPPSREGALLGGGPID